MKQANFFSVSVVLIVAVGIFFGYGLMALAALLFVLLAILGNKGKSLEDLEYLLVRQECLPGK